MHFHYYALLHIAKWLNRNHQGARIEECISQNKNELVINLETIILRVGCRTPLTYFVPVDQFAKARKNVAALFEEIEGLAFLKARVVPFERVMILELEENYQLIFKLHGIAANVLLRKSDRIIDLFNQEQEGDYQYTEEEGKFQAQLIDLQHPEANQLKVLDTLRNISSIYEKQFAAKISSIMLEGNSFQEAYELTMKEVEEDNFYIVHEPKKIRFLLFKPTDGYSYIRVKGIRKALWDHLRLHFTYQSYRERYRALEKEIAQPVQKLQKLYSSYGANKKQLEVERNPEEIGHLIMANLHNIEPGTKSVKVEDFFCEGTLKIKLKPNLNPQENAKIYYDKHKRHKIQLAYLQDQLEDIEQRLVEAELELERFQTLIPPEKLPLTPAGFDAEAIQTIKKLFKQTEKEQAEIKKYPYHHYKKQGFDIFVGKNARNNDELSFKFAHKNDLWLHVKDVPGSHVIIRSKSGQSIPTPVLEYAAQLAAYYSKRKTDTLVPVLYTPRKYIRKRKGDPPGLVVVAKEDVIMVEPVRK